MKFLHTQYFAHCLLISLMLLAQWAVVVHDAQHGLHEQNELCHVFATADSAKAVLSDNSSVGFAVYQGWLFQPLISTFFARPFFRFSARAPPLFH